MTFAKLKIDDIKIRNVQLVTDTAWYAPRLEGYREPMTWITGASQQVVRAFLDPVTHGSDHARPHIATEVQLLAWLLPQELPECVGEGRGGGVRGEV